MTIKEKKKEIIDWVSETEENDSLDAIHDLIFDLTHHQVEILDSLSSVQQKKLEEAIQDANEGKLTPHKEIKSRYGL